MVDLVYYLRNLLFFDIPLLYYHINFTSSLFFVFLPDIYIFFFRNLFIMLICNRFWVFLLWSFWGFCNFIIDFITNNISKSTQFLNCSFWDSFTCICSRLFAVINKLLAIYFAHIFTHIFTHILSKRQKRIAFYF